MIPSIRLPNSPSSASSARRTGAPEGGGTFSAASSQGSGAGQARGIVPTSAMTSVSAMMALQEVDDPAGRRAKAMRRGNRLLDDLDDLKISLLEGRVNSGKLARITSLVASHRDRSGEDGLDDVLDGIDLRARVELAKLGR